jgi:glyoxylase-like metal-dependent hydrolase (beta-lactamase superfamily II)
MAKITAFQVGFCTHPAGMAIKGGGFRRACFPSRAYLIQTSQGMYLWDTGYSTHFFRATKGIFRLYPLVTPICFAGQEALIHQLSRMGIHPDDLNSIVISHFHADHIAGLGDFPNVHTFCDAEAWQSIQGLRGVHALRKAFLPSLIPPRIQEKISFIHELPETKLPPELLPFQVGWDLTGTEEVLVVPLPGHAKGHIGAFIQEDCGWTLLASDAAWRSESYIQLRGPSELSFLVHDTRSDYYDTLRKLHLLYRNGKTNIQLTHQHPDTIL